MKVVVFGLGALGTVFATFLKKDGHTVYGITKDKYIPYFKNNTVSVEGIWGNHEAQLDGIFSDVNEIPDKEIDLVIITVKSYDTKQAVESIKPLVKEKTLVLIAQNGYGNYETAVEELREKHVLLGRVIFGSQILRIGHAKVTVNADDVRVGDPSGTIPEENILKIVCAIKHSGIPASYDPDVYKVLWDKILYNCALNPLGAILECNYGTLAENKETREIMDKIIDEIFFVAKEKRIELNWRSSEEYKKHFYEKLILPTKDHFPSMYQDIKSGKKTEIDALNGAIVKLAKEIGLKVPVNETITNIIKAKEKLQKI